MKKLKQLYLALSEKERRIFFLASAVLGIVILAFGIRIIRATTTALPTAGGELTEGLVGQPIFLNPVLAKTDIDKSMAALIFSRLEDLATQINLMEDGLTWKVRIKEGVVWSDGKELKSEDVVFTVSKIQDEEARSPLYERWRGVEAKRLSDLEVQFEISGQLASAFEKTLRNLYILPKHVFKDTPPSNWRLSDYNLEPVGSGPYRFLAYDKGKDAFIRRYELQANPDYFSEKPLIEKFNFKFFRSQEDLVAAFNTGEIDAFDGSEVLDWEDLKRPYQVNAFELPTYYAIFINQSKNPVLQETAVRKSLHLLTPRQRITDEVLLGRGRVQESLMGVQGLPSGTEDGAALLEPEEILQAAGWERKDIDLGSEVTDPFLRKTVKKEELKLEVNLTVPETSQLVAVAKAIQETWEGAGIKTNLIVKPLPEIQSLIENRDYEMILYGHALDLSLDLYPFWHSSERFYPGLNLSLYNSKQADRILERLREETEETRRQANIAELAKAIQDDYPAIFLFSPNYTYLTSVDLKGLEGRAMTEPWERFLDVSSWHLKTVRVFK